MGEKNSGRPELSFLFSRRHDVSLHPMDAAFGTLAGVLAETQQFKEMSNVAEIQQNVHEEVSQDLIASTVTYPLFVSIRKLLHYITIYSCKVFRFLHGMF